MEARSAARPTGAETGRAVAKMEAGHDRNKRTRQNNDLIRHRGSSPGDPRIDSRVTL